MPKRKFNKNRKRYQNKRQNKKPCKDVCKRLINLEKKIKDVKLEYKYVYTGPYVKSGETPDTMSASPYFYSNPTGHICEIPLAIARGDEYNQRIGHEVMLQRIMVQLCVRWPMLNLTPLWNSGSTTATSNSAMATNAAATRLTIPCKIYILRMEHADGSFAAFEKYLNGFKKMFDIKEHMNAESQDIKRQEVKVIASKSFNLKRSVTFNYSSGALQTHFSNKVSEMVINIPMHQKLIFNKAPNSDNNPQNYRYGYVLQFGTLNDNLITGSAYKVTKTYNPIVQSKFNFWYTDN